MVLTVKNKKDLKNLNMKNIRKILCQHYGDLLKEALKNKDWPTMVAITTEAYNKCPKDANVYYALAMLSHGEENSYHVVEDLIEKAEKLEAKDPSITPIIKGQAIIVATQVKIRDIFIKQYSKDEKYDFPEDMKKAYKKKDFNKSIEIASSAFKNHPDDPNAWYSIALVTPYTEFMNSADLRNIIEIANNLKGEKDEYLEKEALKLL